ncbi:MULTISPECIES: polysaccharide biosynthesis protein [unclassified Arthrobacter]|uniref:polysaccharide biosynthesis protein n=1 Tax=unclassified Arthrobacter TaxID=235627 RepID=UPI00339454E9
MKTVLFRLLGFTGLPLLSLVTPFLLLPVLSRLVGDAGWSSLLAGQAIGTFGATVIAWGWNMLGPVQIAKNQSPGFRAELYRESMRTRLLLSLVVLPVVSLLSAVLAVPELRLEAVAMSWTTALGGLSVAWYCIGLGKPSLLAKFDTIPRVIASLVAIPVVLATGAIWLYGLLFLLAVAVSLVLFQRWVVPAGRSTFTHWAQTPATLRSQMASAGISASGNTYAATPLPIAQGFVDAAPAGQFGSADTIYRFGLFSVMALGNTFQGWVLEHREAPEGGRHVLAIWSHVALGVVGGGLLALLGPTATEILFGSPVKATQLTCLFYGLAFFFISAASPFSRNLLIPFGGEKLILAWTAVSAVLGLATMIAAGMSNWADGIALGMACSEAVLFAGLILPALRRLRNLDDHRAPVSTES